MQATKESSRLLMTVFLKFHEKSTRAREEAYLQERQGEVRRRNRQKKRIILDRAAKESSSQRSLSVIMTETDEQFCPCLSVGPVL
ncbi:hypothetical protein NPIL_213961 [Nephila pilipes]|uniref:Uncharacterized protein n=1 Tax=Nephila pilipes TaxID=299642 RepID=A0A8X6P687_NEPPI|nr:hypothetical protein NPIL_213961 [Nephila pilipes]